jgi:hypothetical protein
MTLKEKFDAISCSDCDMPYCDVKCTTLAEYELNHLEKVADEFAIGFAEWVTLKYPNQRKFLLKQGDLKGFYTTKELLEIYKEEKDL